MATVMPDELTIDGEVYVRAEKSVTLNGVLYVYAKPSGDQMLTVAQIAELTGRCKTTVNRVMNAGLLPYTTPNGCVRPRWAKRSDVEAWMEGRTAHVG